MSEQESHLNSKLVHQEIAAGAEFINVITRWSWILYGGCVIFQSIFFPDFVNLMMILCVAVAWAIAIRVFLRPAILRSFPLSTFLVLGYASTQFYFPLLFTTLEGKPLIYNLELPEQVFLHSFAGLIVLVLAHLFYRLLSKLTYSRSFSLMGKAGFFTPPTELQMWLIGFVGMASFLYVYLVSQDVTREVTGSASDKLIAGLVPFSYAPFFIPLEKLLGSNKVNIKRFLPMILIYTIVLFILSIGRNSRGAFMYGLTAVAFAYALGLLLGVYQSKIFTLKNAVIAGFGVWLLVGPLADLGTAMVIVRSGRTETPPLEMIDKTIEAYQDKDAIEARRLYDQTREGEEWDERYLDNVFTARFANIKFNDVSLVHASIVREYDPDMFEFSIDRMLASLPDPFLKTLGIDVDKERTHSLSMGDYLYVAAGGSGPIVGFRTGHFAGSGITAFGWWYLLLFGIGMIFVFFLFDKFLKKKQTPGESRTSNQQLQFSLCGILAITHIFAFLPVESVVEIAEFLIRGWLQLAILYLLVFHFTRLLTSFIGKSRSVRFRSVRWVNK